MARFRTTWYLEHSYICRVKKWINLIYVKDLNEDDKKQYFKKLCHLKKYSQTHHLLDNRNEGMSNLPDISWRDVTEYLIDTPSVYTKAGLEISQNKICGGECDSCKFELNKNTLLFSIDVIGIYFRPWKEALKAFKSLEAYDYFVCGHVQNCFHHGISSNSKFCFI